jgi:predicted 3-demethylubiquinone-9 3-methyltransferase (glyoxalase superfamily)
MPSVTQRIAPFLWFDGQAEEAARFYTSIFQNSKIRTTTRYDDATARAAGRPPGTVMTVDFTLDGQDFVALNGGPVFQFTEAISLVVSCDTQAEIDHFWDRLSAGGQQVQCGWLKDRFGVSWQVVPRALSELMADPERAKRVMAAVLTMKKLDVAALKSA